MSRKPDKNEPPVGYYPKIELTEAELMARGEYNSPRKRPPMGRIIFMAVCAAVFVTSMVLLINYFSNINRAKQATAQLRDIYTQSSPSPEADSDILQLGQLSITPSTEPDDSLIAALPSEPDDQLQQPTATVLPIAAPPAAPTTVPTVANAVVSFTDLWPSDYADNPMLRISDSFQTLRQQNRDIVGWLTIEGVLDEPVLQRDNDFYLTHDATGAENVTGALFLDENCNLRLLPNNLLIHGHNMKEGAMFGSLKNTRSRTRPFIKRTLTSPSTLCMRKPNM